MAVIAGVLKIKDVSSWAITRAEKTQISLFLPNEQSMDWQKCFAHGVAGCTHNDGDKEHAQGSWSRLSLHAEEVLWGALDLRVTKLYF